MKILLHICCAPCLIHPLGLLRREGHEITGCFYNPNIHPSREYLRRLDTLKEYSNKQGLAVVWPPQYDLEDFLRRTAASAGERCVICYEMRLRYVVETARRLQCDAFTTTLLYSIYQKHESIRQVGEQIGLNYGMPFYYRDFRGGWQQGISAAKEALMYRQSYCGCIYSEKERFWRTTKQ